MSSRTELAVSRRAAPTRAVHIASVIGALAIAVLLFAFAATKSALAATALFVGGVAEPVMYEPLMGQALGGMFTGTDSVSGTPWVRKSVQWPAQAVPYYGVITLGASVSQGTTNLIAAIKDPNNKGPITVIGASAGALVVDETLRYVDEHPAEAPPKDQLTFVVIGDGSRQDSFGTGSLLSWSLSGYTYRVPPETQYDVKVVTYEYDGFADFPDRPWNLLAVSNALAGTLLLHNSTYFVDLDTVPAEVGAPNEKGGVTTRYLVKAKTLPLVALNPSLALMEPQLKKLVDSGYSRNDAVSITNTAALTSTVTEVNSTVAQPQNSSPTDAVETSADPADPIATVAPPQNSSPTDAVETSADPADPIADALADARTRTNEMLANAQRTVNQITDRLHGNTVTSDTATASSQLPTGTTTADPFRDAVKNTVDGIRNTVNEINRSLSQATQQSRATAGTVGDSGAGTTNSNTASGVSG